MNPTRKFWGGLLLGAGVGMFVGGVIVEHRIEPEESGRLAVICVVVRHSWQIVVPSLALVLTGVALSKKWRAAGPPEAPAH